MNTRFQLFKYFGMQSKIIITIVMALFITEMGFSTKVGYFSAGHLVCQNTIQETATFEDLSQKNFIENSSMNVLATIKWTNGNGTGLWNDAGNWDSGTVPGSADIVHFDATSTDNCTIDTDPVITRLIVFAAYTGTISLGTQTLTISSEFTVPAAANFDSGTGLLKVTGSVTLNSVAPVYDLEVDNSNHVWLTQDITVDNDLTLTDILGIQTNDIVVKGNIIANDGDYTGNGYIVAGGTSNQTLSGSGEIYRLDVSTSGGSLQLPAEFPIDLALRGTGNIENTGGKLILAGATQLDFSGTVDDVEINNSNKNITVSQVFNINNSLTISSVNSISPSNINVGGNIISNDDTYTGNSFISAVGTGDRSLSGTGDIYRLDVSNTGGSLQLPADFPVEQGLTGSGNIGSTGGKLVFSGPTQINFSGTVDDVEINNSNKNITVSQEFNINNTLTITSVNSISSSKINVSGNIISNDDTFTGGSFISAVGTSNQTLSGTGDIYRFDVSTTGGNLQLPADFQIEQGLTGSGNIENTGGKLVFTGPTQIDFSGTIDDVDINNTDKPITLLQDLNVSNSLFISSVNSISNGSIKVSGDIITNDDAMGGSVSSYISAVGSTDQNISGTGKLYNLDVSKTGGVLKLLNDITLENLAHPQNAQLTGSGTIENAGGKLIFGDAMTINYSGTVDDVEINISNSSIILSQDFNVNNTLTITSLNQISGGKVKVSGDIITNDDAVGGFVDAYISAVGSTDQNISGTGRIFNLDVSKTGGVLKLLNDITLENIAHPQNAQLTGSGTIENAGGKLIFGDAMTINYSGTVDDVEINNSNSNVTVSQELNINNTLTITSVNSISSSKINVSGNIISNDDTFTGGSYISAVGTANQTLSGTGDIYRLDVSTTGGNLQLPADFPVEQGLTGSGNIENIGGKLVFSGPTQIDFSGTIDDVDINNTDKPISLLQDLNVNNSLLISSVYQFSNASIKVSGDIITNDDVMRGTGSSYISAVGSTDQNLSGTGRIHNLDVSKTGGVLKLLNDITLENLAHPQNAQLTGTGTIENAGGKLIFADWTTLNFSGTVDDVEFNTANGIVFVVQDLNVENTLTLTDVLAFDNNFIKVKGNIISNDDTYTGNCFISAVGTANRTLTGTGDIYRLDVSTTGGKLQLPVDFPVEQGLTGSGDIENTGGKLVFTGPTQVNFSGTVDDVDINNANKTITLSQVFNVNNTLSLTDVQHINSNNINVSGNITATDTNIGGNGKLVLAGSATNSFTGQGGGSYPRLGIEKTNTTDIGQLGSNETFISITVEEGQFDINNKTATGNTTINDGGTLIGNGTILSTITANSGGTISPGTSPGCLTINGLVQNTGSILHIEIDGNTACSNFDQLIVNGTVQINGATLTGNTTTVPTGAITIIENDGADGISGTGFSNATPNVTLGGTTYITSMTGGTGNDFTLSEPLPEIDVQGNSMSIMDGDTSPSTDDYTDFGEIANGSSSTHVFTIENTGVGNLNLAANSITVNSDIANVFTLGTVSETLPHSLAPNESMTFEIIFSPNAGNSTVFDGDVQIDNNDIDENPYTFDIRGTGGNVGSALDFDGSNDFVNAGTTGLPTGDTDHTVEFWVNYQGGQSGQRWILWHGTIGANQVVSYGLDASNGNRIRVHHNSSGNDLLSNVVLPTSQWTHLAFVYHASTNTSDIYLNGNYQESLGFSTDLNLTSANFQLGTYSSSSSFAANMQLDELRIWNKAQTCHEIGHYKDCELTGGEANLVAYFQFNHGLADGDNNGITTLDDLTTNNNDGTLQNFVLSGSNSNWTEPGGVTTGSNCSSLTFPDMDVKGNGNSITNGDDSPDVSDNTQFGEVGIVVGNKEHSFVIENTGTANLILDGAPIVDITGTGVAHFSVSMNPTSPVSTSGSTTFKITFAPTTVGVHSATVSISNDDCDVAPYTFDIEGTGTDPEITIFGNGEEIVDGDASPSTTDDTDFGGVDINGSSDAHTFTVTNTGVMNLNLSGNPIVEITGTGAAHFTVTTDPDASITSGGSTTFVITFAPDVAGVHTAEISIVNDDATETPYNFSISGTGTGTAPDMDVQGMNVSIVDGDNTPDTNDDTDFGGTPTVGGMVSHTFTIENTGTADLILSGAPQVQISGTHASDFTVTANPSSPVSSGGGTTTFTIKFDPSAGGLRTAEVTIANNDFYENPYNFSIQGTGQDGDLEILGNTMLILDGDTSPSTDDDTDFGPIAIGGCTDTHTFTISNVGFSPINLTGNPIVAISGSHSGDFSISQPSTNVVAAMSSVTFEVTFDPSATGLREASLSIDNDDPDENPYNFDIQGDGFEISAVLSGTAAICDGESTDLTVNITGGSGLYTVIYNDGSSNNTVNNYTSGTGISVSPGVGLTNYSLVSVTDANNCTASTSGTATITVNSLPSLTDQTPSICEDTEGNGEATNVDLSALESAIGGTGGVWKDATNTTVGDPTAATVNGTTNPFTYEYTDGNTCTSTATVTYTIENLPSASASGGELTCTQTTLQLSASTNASNATFSWSTGDGTIDSDGSTSTPTISAPGTYTVTIINTDNSCQNSTSVTVTQDILAPTADIGTSAAELNCTTTTITLNAAGSTVQGTASYIWTGGSTNSTLDITSPGTYSVTVTDSDNGCTDEESITITQDIQAPTADISAPGTELTCATTTITLDAAGSATQGNATYLWTGGSTNSTLDVTSPGTYSVTITDGDNGCTDEESIVITQDIAAPTADISTSGTELTCITTTITIDATGSTVQGTASYLWTGGSTNSTLDVTSPGSYTVTVTDSDNGCTDEESILITQDIQAPTANISSPGTELTCTITTITLDGAGSVVQGTATYLWTGGSTNSTLDVTSPGTYTVTVTDSDNGCTDEESILITQDIMAPTANISSSGTELTCMTTTITLNGAGSVVQGTATYLWTGGSTNSTLDVTSPGTYTVTVTDSYNGCTDEESIVITQDIMAPTANISSSETELTCMTTTITLDGTGSVVQGAATYLWTGGSTNSTLDVTSPGTYTVTITDSDNGCTDEESIVITQDILAPVADISTSATELTCVTTSITLDAGASIVQGTATYLWTGGSTNSTLDVTSPGTYTVTITDSDNGCTDEENVVITQDILNPISSINYPTTELTCTTTSILLDASGLTLQGSASYVWTGGGVNATLLVTSPGTYTVTVTDSDNGCTDEESIVITQDILNPTASINTSTTELTCMTTSISLNATGSTVQGTASYLWTGGSTNSTLTVSSPGTYTVTVTDSDNGCTEEESIVITQDIQAPTADIGSTGTELTCVTTTITLDASGSLVQGAASYVWTGGSTNSTLDVTSPGTYTVTVTDGDNGCTDEESIVITQDIQAPTANISSMGTELTCATTTITLDAGGSTVQGLPSYLWTGGSTNSTLDVTSAGTYTVTITDGDNGCTDEESIVITQDILTPTAEITTSATELTCSITTITLDATGSTVQGLASYSWTGGSTNSTLDVTSPGTYTVTITDSDNGCTDEESIVITQDILASSADISASGTELTCSITIITLDATGSTVQGTASYLWTGGSTNSTLDVSNPGTYAVTVTDIDNGCTSEESILITQDILAPTADVGASTTELTCATITITLDASGSTVQGIASYLWTGGSTNSILTVSSPGTYTVTVTDSDNGCTEEESIVITQDIVAPTADIVPTGTELTCATTTITLDAGGSIVQGTASYLWTGGSTNSTLAVISPGTYTVTITDSDNGCTDEESIVITQDIVTPTADIVPTGTALTCAITTITLDAGGSMVQGTASYLWTGGGTNSILDVTAPGTYTVTITDSDNGCTDEESIVISQDILAPTADIVSTGTELTCTITTITLDAGGSMVQGTASYLWTGGGTNSTLDVTVPGTYTVTITDSDNGCTYEESIVITQDILAPTADIIPTGTALTCSTPTINLDAGGSTVQGMASYLWTGGGTNSTLDVTAPGTYTVTVTDSDNGCTDEESIVISQDILAPTADIVPTGTELTCAITTISLDAGGSIVQGTASYLWTGGSTNSTLAVSSPGTYTVTITDSENGCTDEESLVISQDLLAPIAGISATGTELTCATTTITLDAGVSTSQGTASYLWTGGGTNSTLAVTNPGTYTVTITDSDNGCTDEESIVISQDILAPTADIVPTGTELTCSITMITLDAVGSTVQGTASYLWTGGGTNSTLDVTVPGTYTVTITDSDNGCTDEESIVITQDILAPIADIGATGTELTCATTTITLFASGSIVQGTASYLWTGGGTNSTLAVTSPGTYTVTITDSDNGCTDEESIVITQDISVPTADISATEVELTCTTTTITVDAAGSTVQGTATYLWTGGSTNSTIDVISPGTYTVTVTDGDNGCTAEESIVITQDILAPTADINATTAELTCTTTTITLDAAGSTVQGTATYFWTDGSMNSTIDVTSPGTYTVTITDSDNGCTDEESIVISQDILVPSADISTTTTELTCTTTTITLDAAGSTLQGTATYFWTGGSTNSTLDVTSPGTYTVTVTDNDNGCTDEESIVITQDILIPTAVINSTATELTCATTMITLDAAGSTVQGTVTYLWTGGSTNSMLDVTSPGTYTVTVTDNDNGCTNEESIVITQDILTPTVDISSAMTELTCATTTITLDAGGSTFQGSAGYLWTGGSTNSTLNVSSPGVYSVTVTDSDNGCTDEESIVITQDILEPTADISVSATELTCTTTTITLDGAGSTVQGTASYLWTGGSTNSTLNVSNPGIYTVTITDSDNGCTDEESIVITQDILAPVANAGSDVEMCFGDNTTLDASASTGQGSLIYSWSPATGLSQTDIANPVADPQVTTTYILTILDTDNGCTATDEVTVNVNDNPTITIDLVECAINLLTYQIGLNTDADQLLTSSGSVIDMGGGNYIINQIPSGNNVTLTVINSTTLCESQQVVTAPDCSCPVINAPFNTGDIEICMDETIPALIVEVGMDETVDWYDAPTGGNLLLEGSTTYTPTTAGTFYAETRNLLNDCVSFVRTSVSLTINVLPMIDFTDPADVCIDGENINLIATPMGGTFSGLGVNGDTFNPMDAGVGIHQISYTYTDLNGCTNTENIQIEVFALPNVSFTDPPDICVNASAIALMGTPIGGTFSGLGVVGNQFDPSLAGVGIHDLIYTFTNGNGCSNFATVQIEVFAQPQINPSSNSPVCQGEILQLNAGSSGSNDYSWSGPNGFTSFQANPLIFNSLPIQSGTYTVTITSEDGCTSVASTDVNIVELPTGTIFNLGTICEGNNLVINVINTNATSFNWSGPDNFTSTDQSVFISGASPINSGTYTVTLTDDIGCSSVLQTDVTVHAAPTLTLGSNAPFCESNNLELTASTAFGITQWFWEGPNGFTSIEQNPVIPGADNTYSGIYTLTATDLNGCNGVESIFVEIYDSPVAQITVDFPVCEGDDLQLLGSDAQEWSWSGPNGFTSSEQNPVIENIAQGTGLTYSLTVTDGFGCTNTDQVSFDVGTAPIVMVSSNSPIEAGQDIELNEFGGQAVEWFWSGPDGFNSSEQNPLITSAGLINGGMYYVTITDLTGCSSVDSTLVFVDGGLAVASSNSPVCEGEVLQLFEVAGLAEQWSWSGPNGFVSTLEEPFIENVTTDAAGWYFVTVTDPNGFMEVDSVEVEIIVLPTVEILTNSPVCEGGDLELFGIADNVSWQWEGPNGFTSSIGAHVLTNIALSDAGIYSLTVTDMTTGCTNIAMTNVEILSPPNIQITGPSEICEGLPITLNEEGGSAISWQWEGPNGFTSSDSGFTIPNASFDNDGIYSLTITDSQGCENISIQQISILPLPFINIESNMPICIGSNLELMETLTTAGSYVWTHQGNFISDEQNPVIENVTQADAGSYQLTYTNANGCSTTSSIDININEPETVTISGASDLCEGETLQLEGIGNGESWSWNGPNGFSSSDQNPSIESITLDAAGIYILIMTDANGCTAEETHELLVHPGVAANITANNPLCKGEDLQLIENSGQADSWLWTGPNGFMSTDPNPVVTGIQESGIYTVEITAGNCNATAEIFIEVNTPPAIDISTNAPIVVGADLIIETSSNQPGNMYAWSGPNNFNSNEFSLLIQNAQEINSGMYVVTVTDVNNCISVDSVVIDVLDTPILISGDTILCEGQTLELSETGGVADSHSWTAPDGSFISNQSSILLEDMQIDQGGYYTVSITVGAQTISDSVMVIVEDNPNVNLDVFDEICEGEDLELFENGGDAVEWIWEGPGSFSSTDQNPLILGEDNPQGGLYSVTVTNSIGCTSSGSIEVEIFPLPSADISVDESCEGEDLILMLDSEDGNTFLWNGPNGFTSSEQNPTLSAATIADNGDYEVVVTSPNGCTNIASVTVEVQNAPSITASSTDNICEGEMIQFTAEGIDIVEWSWTGPDGFSSMEQNPTIDMANTAHIGTYTLIASHENGCTAEMMVEVNNIFPTPIINIEGNTTISLGQNLDLLASSDQNGDWLWQTASGDSYPTAALFITNVDESDSGEYLLSFTSENGCIVEMTITVNVIDSPIVINSNSPLCEGETLELEADFTGTAVSYEWTFENGNMATGATVNLENIQLSDEGTYFLTVTDDIGTTFTASIDVEVKENPVAIASSVSLDVCEGGSIELLGNGGEEYEWSHQNGYFSIQQNPVIDNVSTEDAGEYTLTVSNAEGCTSQATVMINIISNPSVEILGNTTVPLNGDITLNAAGDPVETFFWQSPTGSTFDTPSILIENATVADGGVYSLVVTTAEGCTNETSVEVVVSDSPLQIESNSPLCEGQTLELSEIASNAQSWDWTGPDGTPYSGNNLMIDNPLPGNYSLTITDDMGATFTGNIDVEINPLPLAVPSVGGEVCENQTLELFANSIGATAWNWEGPDGSIYSDENPQIDNISTLQGGIYNLTITSDEGCTSQSSVDLIVNPAPVVDLQGPEVIGLGGTLTLTEQGDGTDWNWIGPNGFMQTGGNEISIDISTFDQAGIYSVTVTGDNTCTASAELEVEIVQVLADAGVDQEVCEGTDLQLMESGGGSGTWTWTDLDGNILFNEQNPIITNLQSTDQGAYIVTIDDGMGNMDTDTVFISILEQPNVNISGTDEICENEAITLSEDGGDPNIQSWEWMGPNAFSEITQNISIPMATVPSEGTYQVLVTGMNGCTNTSDYSVMVNPVPIVEFSTNAPLCEGGDLMVAVSTPDIDTYNWTSPLGDFSESGATFNQVNSITGSGDYNVTITDVNGCTAQDVLSVLVYQTPVINLSTNAPLCEGETLLLEETGGQASTWDWTGPEGYFTSIPSPSIDNILQINSGYYAVSITDANGCENLDSIEAVVNLLPIVELFSSSPVCTEEDLELLETGGEASSWLWEGPNGFTATGSEVVLENGAFDVGTYSLTVTDDNGCSQSTETEVTTALGQQIESNLLIPEGACIGDTIHFFDISIADTIPDAFFWTFGDGNTSTERDPTHTYQAEGNYEVTVTVISEECENVSIAKLIAIENCRRLGEGSTIFELAELSPSVNDGHFNLEVDLLEMSDLNLEIVDINGRIIHKELFKDVSSYSDSFFIENKGFYFVYLRTKNRNGFKVLKLLVVD